MREIRVNINEPVAYFNFLKGILSTVIDSLIFLTPIYCAIPVLILSYSPQRNLISVLGCLRDLIIISFVEYLLPKRWLIIYKSRDQCLGKLYFIAYIFNPR